MARKLVLAIAAGVMAASLAGCAEKVEGSVETVVEACQDFPTDANVEVTVTGTVVNDDAEDCDPGHHCSVWLSDEYYDYSAWCEIDNVTEEEIREARRNSRVTVVGKLVPEMVSYRSVHLENCRIVLED